MNDQIINDENILEMTVDIVAAYVSNNPVPASELPSLISSVNASILALGRQPVAKELPLTPAVNPKRSVHDDHIVCLEDGKKFKSLKRHIAAHHGLSPDEYRAKWRLPADYPMVAPKYSAARSILAKQLGLGRKHKVQPEPTAVLAKRGRMPKIT